MPQAGSLLSLCKESFEEFELNYLKLMYEPSILRNENENSHLARVVANLSLFFSNKFEYIFLSFEQELRKLRGLHGQVSK